MRRKTRSFAPSSASPTARSCASRTRGSSDGWRSSTARTSSRTGTVRRTQARSLHRELGIEPLTAKFTTRWLREFLRRRGRSAIKPLLLDQRGIAGVGNIYDVEALWRARIHPLRTAGSLRPDEVARLREALRFVLRKGIRLGGASRRDYVDARGAQGRMQREFQVYDRAGEPCPRCGACDRAHGRGRPRDVSLPALPESGRERRGAPESVRETSPTAQDGHMSVLSVQAVARWFGAREVLKDVSFRIGHGDRVGLVGPNGTRQDVPAADRGRARRA